MFEVSSYTLNMVATQDEVKVPFPGNISPEGYFYSPFYKVALRELDDELQYSDVKRINFNPDEATVTTASTTFYNPDDGSSAETTVRVINIVSPVAYSLIENQPFCIYDILSVTLRDSSYGTFSSTSTATYTSITNFISHS